MSQPSTLLPTTPPSPTKRRRLLRSSEETEGTMSIEYFLYASDAYRKITVAVPTPLPISKTLPSENIRVNEALRRQIQATLREFGIEQEFQAQIYSTSKPEYPDRQAKFLTLIISFWDYQRSTASWSDARDELKRVLENNGRSSVEVEMVDNYRAFCPSLFPIKSDESAVDVYEAKREDFMKLLNEKLPGNWLMISLFNVGRFLSIARPTVVVLVEPWTQADWQELTMRFNAILRSADGYGQDVGIEFLPGESSENVAGQRLETDILSFHRIKPGLGASIGLQVPGGGGGTIGGIVHLKAGGKIYEGVITNHHVIQPSSNASDQEKEEAAKGYNFDPLKLDRPSCQVPHENDLKTLQAAISTEVKSCEEDLAKFQRKYDESEMIHGEARPSEIEKLQAAQDQLTKILKLQVDLECLPVDVGRLLVSSGQHVTPKLTRLDWAFVGKEVTQPSFVQPGDRPNRLPTDNSLFFSGQSPGYYIKNARYLTGAVPSYSPVAFSEVVKDQWYFKVGRTTNITAGICNGVKADVPLTDWDVYYTEKGDKLKVDGRTIRHWVMMNRYNKANNIHDAPFCAPGDFGSFIIDSEGDVAGLLYGHFSNFSYGNGGMGLVSCMSEVVPSIERRTTVKDENGNDIRGELTLAYGGRA